MSALAYDETLSKRRAGRIASLRRALTDGWRLVRPVFLVALPVVLLAVGLGFATLGILANALERKVAALRGGRDVAVSINAAPELLLARIQYLLAHERVEEVQPFVEALDRSGSSRARAIAHYNFGNGRLREAFDELTAQRIEKAGPFVVLARQEYRRALTFEPDLWDAKFNLDVASRLVRDFPAFERTMGDEVKTKKKLWTDVPGKPEGLP